MLGFGHHGRVLRGLHDQHGLASGTGPRRTGRPPSSLVRHPCDRPHPPRVNAGEPAYSPRTGDDHRRHRRDGGSRTDGVHGRPYLLMIALFVLTCALGQIISNTATVLIVVPIAVSAALEIGLSVEPIVMLIAAAGAASFPTPIATPADLMVMTPGGYRFGDHWRLGLPLMVLWLAVVVGADLGWLEGLITRRVPLERFTEALTARPDDIKVVLTLT
ncbi:SLC13 family permease [Planobispora takensis]|nr:SLC13 family permease [Planobispora takensis]